MGRRWAKVGPTWFKMGQKPAGEQDKRIARPVSRQRVNPAALPLGSTRSRTQIAFSPQRGLASAEIHGVESPKRGAEFHFPQICTTPIRNACFLHKWPSGLTGGGGSRHAQPVSSGPAWLQHGVKKSIKTCNCRNFQGLGLQKHETVVIFSA